MYDKDGNGSVDLAEMVEIIGTLYDMEGASKVSEAADCNLRGKCISIRSPCQLPKSAEFVPLVSF